MYSIWLERTPPYTQITSLQSFLSGMATSATSLTSPFISGPPARSRVTYSVDHATFAPKHAKTTRSSAATDASASTTARPSAKGRHGNNTKRSAMKSETTWIHFINQTLFSLSVAAFAILSQNEYIKSF